MAEDQLSEVFDLVEVQGQLSGAFTGQGHWFAHSRISKPVKLVAMVRGHGRLTTDGIDVPARLDAGDIAILTNRSWLRLEGGSGDEPAVEIFPETTPLGAGLANAAPDADVIVGGHVDISPAGQSLLLHALPPVAHVRAAAAAVTSMGQVIDRLIDEVASARIGSAFAIRQYGQLLLLEALRAYMDQADLPPGLLRLLADSRLRPAVSLMHAHPGRNWQLRDLAQAAAMSRSTFAERFRDVAGVPPVTYLATWRILLAQRALRHRDVPVNVLAAELGYTSGSAFSTAFRRATGVSPLRFRQRQRAAGKAPQTGPGPALYSAVNADATWSCRAGELGDSDG